MPSAIESQGVTIKCTVGSPTGTLTTIANVTGFNGPGGAASVIDITNLSSTAHEKLMGLPDEGQFTIDINYDPDNAAHIALRNARKTRTRVEFQVTLTDSTATVLTFWGYVLGFAISGGVDKQVTASITVEIDGPVAEA
jgi:hypothetical protein